MGIENKIHHRLEILMTHKGVNKNQLAKKLNLGSSYIGNMIKGTDFGVSKLQALTEAFPDVSIDWLLHGKGDMLKEKNLVNEEIERLNNQIEDLTKENKELSVELRESQKDVIALYKELQKRGMKENAKESVKNSA